jgi:hypothetical protein
MWLYYTDDGLTRLRFLVFGFLLFELLGLLFTFFYIIKPRFNLVAVYLLIGLTYYVLLNLVPMDYFIAKSQVDRCLAGNSSGITYTLTLSPDATPQLERLLYEDNVDAEIKAQVVEYLDWNIQRHHSTSASWQRFNLSVHQLEEIRNSGLTQFQASPLV